ncbi:hypothetical protein pb186bvf_001634 [Paramecium bursaria]
MQVKSFCIIQGHDKSPIILICLNKHCTFFNRKICKNCLNQHSDCQKQSLLFDEVELKEKYNAQCEQEIQFRDKINLLIAEFSDFKTWIANSIGDVLKKLREMEDDFKRQEQDQLYSLKGFQIQEQMIQKLLSQDQTIKQLQTISSEYNKIRKNITEKLEKLDKFGDSQKEQIIPQDLKRSQIKLLSSAIQLTSQNPYRQYKLPKIGDLQKIIVRENMLIAQSENQIDIYEKSIPTLSLYFKPHPISKIQFELSDTCRYLVLSCHNQINVVKFSYDIKNSISHKTQQSNHGIKQILFLNSSTILTLQENNIIVSYNLDPFDQVMKLQLQNLDQIKQIDYCQSLDLLMVKNSQISFYDYKKQTYLSNLEDGEYVLAKFSCNNQFITSQYQNIQIWTIQQRDFKPIKQEIQLNFNIINFYPTDDDIILQIKENDMISLNNQNKRIQINCQHKLIAASSFCVLKNQIIFAYFNKNQIIDKFINIQTYQLWNK